MSYDMNGNGKIGSVSVDKANIMSVPVGVTISKEYFSKEWSFQPSIDLNLTATLVMTRLMAMLSGAAFQMLT